MSLPRIFTADPLGWGMAWAHRDTSVYHQPRPDGLGTVCGLGADGWLVMSRWAARNAIRLTLPPFSGCDECWCGVRDSSEAGANL